MKLDIYMHSCKGGRQNNEDCCDYVRGDESSVFVLADGLGGHDCGEVASEIAVKTAISALEDNTDSNLWGVISEVNRKILQEQASDPSLKKMRTTIVCAKVLADQFVYANIGDSRLYYFKNGKMLLRTKDHSVPQVSVDMGQLDELSMRYSDDRNKLLKVLGESAELSLPKEYPAINLEKGDAFLLCSDGLWENIFDLEMEIDLLKSETSAEWGHRMLKRLLLRISGNHDNYSLICAKVL